MKNFLNINLTSEDRHKYRRVNEQNKLFVNKFNDFTTSEEELHSPDVDWEEFFTKSRKKCDEKPTSEERK